jgi:hypothetical protein
MKRPEGKNQTIATARHPPSGDFFIALSLYHPLFVLQPPVSSRFQFQNFMIIDDVFC